MRLAIPLVLVSPLLIVAGGLNAEGLPDLRPAAVDSPIVAQLGGNVSNVASVGSYAYVGIGTRILALDVSEPAHPVPAGWSEALVAPVRHLAVAGSNLYATNGYVAAFDLTEPTRPQVLAMIDAGACRIVPNGSYLYPLGGCGGFPLERVIDVHDPRHPTLGADLPYSQPHDDLVVDGEVGFATCNVFIQVLDVRDPAKPVKGGEVSAEQPLTGRLAYDYPVLYVTTGQGLVSYDVGSLPIPVPGSAFYAGTPGLALAVADQTVFLATESGLSILDVGQAPTITERSRAAVPGAREVTLLAGYAYVTGSGGLSVVDVSDLDEPVVTARVPVLDVANEVELVGETAFVAAGQIGLAVVDLSVATDPRLLAVRDVGFNAERIAVEPGHAYVAGTAYGADPEQASSNLAVVDISAAASPTVRSRITLPGTANDVAVTDRMVYVAAGRSGVSAFDTGDPTALRQVATTEPGDGSASEVFAAPGMLALVENVGGQFDQPATNRLRLFDTTALPELRETGSLTFDSQAESRGIARVGRRLYLPGSQHPIVRMFSGEVPEDLLAVDLTHPTDPRAVGFVPLDAFAKDIAVIDDTAYVAAGRDEFRFDLQAGESLIVLPGFTEPSGPRARWVLDLPEVPRSVAVDGEHAVLALREAGLLIVDIRPEIVERPTAPPPSTTPVGTLTATPMSTSSPFPTATAHKPVWYCLVPYAGR